MKKLLRLIKYKKTILIVLFALLVSFLLLSLKASPEKREAANQGVFVNTMLLEKGMHRPLVKITGTARSRKSTTVTSFVNSKVIDVLFRVGEHVKKGQLLLVLDPEIFLREKEKQAAIMKRAEVQLKTNKAQCTLLTKQVNQFKSLSELAKTDYERKKTLSKKGLGSQLSRDLADEKHVTAERTLNQTEFNLTNCQLSNESLKADYQQAQANAKQAEKNYIETKVYAPYNGVITDQFVASGRTINIGQNLFSMYDPEAVELEALISNKLYKQLIGDKTDVDASLNNPPEIPKGLKACIVPNGTSRCYELKRVGENVSNFGLGHIGFFKAMQGAKIQQGETIGLYLQLPKVEAYLMPTSGVYDNDHLYIISKENRLLRRPIEVIGHSQDPKKEPLSIIKFKPSLLGQRVLTSYVPDARTGLKVRFKAANLNPDKG
ncbi:HlyD family efflux transporter periplasmic adaptor subunit [Francisellaceae bacterium]|nr:HlyD family efflux transporter periplasmic adaptor subunit [Francisellaceae bacterium]